MGTASPVNRQMLDAFNRAYAARDLAALARMIDDNATWSISGPVDLLEFCGTRHGNAAVLDMVGRLRDNKLQLLGTRSGYGMRRSSRARCGHSCTT